MVSSTQEIGPVQLLSVLSVFSRGRGASGGGRGDHGNIEANERTRNEGMNARRAAGGRRRAAGGGRRAANPEAISTEGQRRGAKCLPGLGGK